MNIFLLSLPDWFFGPLRYRASTGGLDVLDHQLFIAWVGKGKIVADLRVEGHLAEIVPCLVELDLCMILGTTFIGTGKTKKKILLES